VSASSNILTTYQPARLEPVKLGAWLTRVLKLRRERDPKHCPTAPVLSRDQRHLFRKAIGIQVQANETQRPHAAARKV
jgi:hypothetical protein